MKTRTAKSGKLADKNYVFNLGCVYGLISGNLFRYLQCFFENILGLSSFV